MAGRSLLRHCAALLTTELPTAVLGAGWPLAVMLLGALPAWSPSAPASALINGLLWLVAAITTAVAVIWAATAALQITRRRHQRHTKTTTTQRPAGFF